MDALHNRWLPVYASVLTASLLALALTATTVASAAEWLEPVTAKHLQIRAGLGTSGIALLPELSYEATTLAQDELIEAARELAGDHREEAALNACDRLRWDPAAHPDLRRWAALERITLLCFASREWEAVAEAEIFLRDNPDDPNALGIKYTIARILAQRRHADFQPTWDDFWDVMTRLLDEHGEDTHPLVVDTLLFARMHVADGGAPYPERYYSQRALDAALRVELAAAEHGDEGLATRMEQLREERIEPRLDPDHNRRRAAEALAWQLSDPKVQQYLAEAYGLDNPQEGQPVQTLEQLLQPLWDFVEESGVNVEDWRE